MNQQQDLGPLQPLMDDETVWEIMVNNHRDIYAARQAFAIEAIDSQFNDQAHLIQVIQTLLSMTGQTLDYDNPIYDARLPDGSRVHVVMPPVATSGPALSIRKAPRASQLPTWETLLKVGSVSADMVAFLQACVKARANIVVCGGTGSGKTTLLNLIANMSHEKHRIIVVEGETDLILPHTNIVRLEARPASLHGKGEITLHQLVESAMKMRPDRIICSEVYGYEVYPLMQAMNTGVDGSMFAIHATNPRDALTRIEILASSANPAFPLLGIRQQIASAIHIIVEIEILMDGWRRIVKITEVAGMLGDAIQTHDIFEFVQTGVESDGKFAGYYAATGHVPEVMERVRRWNIDLPESMFAPH